MTRDEVYAIFNKADSGDVNAMKKAASILIEMSEQHTNAGRIEQALSCIEKSDYYAKKIRAVDPKW